VIGVEIRVDLLDLVGRLPLGFPEAQGRRSGSRNRRRTRDGGRRRVFGSVKHSTGSGSVRRFFLLAAAAAVGMVL